MATVTKVWIEQEECISCEACVGECPEVFEMTDDTCVITADGQKPEFLAGVSEQVVAAAEACPVEAVKYDSA